MLLLDWPAILFAVTSILLAACLFIQQRELARLRSRLDAEVVQVKSEMRGVASASMGVGQKLLQFDAEFRNLVTRVDELIREDPSRVSYSEASRLVGLGAEVEDLVGSCGLSRPEAQLVRAVYSKRKGGAVLNTTV